MKRFFFLITLCFIFYSVEGFAQKHVCPFCHFEVGSKSKIAVTELKNMKLEIEQMGRARMKGFTSKNAPYDKVLLGVASDLKQKHACIDSAFVKQIKWTNSPKPQDFSLYLVLNTENNQKQVGITFDKGNTIEMNRYFVSNDNVVFEENLPEIKKSYPYLDLIGTYYNLYEPNEKISLNWDTTMNSLALLDKGKLIYYFRSPEKDWIEPKAYSYEQNETMFIIPLNEDELVLQFGEGKAKKNFYFKKETQLSEQ